jgi:hypothetical protein
LLNLQGISQNATTLENMENKSLIPTEKIDRVILIIRGHKVMLDSDLAEIY